MNIIETLAAAFALAGGGVIVFGLFQALKYYWRQWRQRRVACANLLLARPEHSPSPHDSPAAEIRKARNLILGLLLLGGLIGLRHLNTVPYRLKVYDENNRIETAADLFGSYYRPIKEGEDAGAGVRHHSLKDAEEAWERYDSPRLAAFRAVEARAWLAAQAEQQTAEEEHRRQECEHQRKQWQELMKMNEGQAVGWQRWNDQALEQNRQARIRRVAQEQALDYVRRSNPPRATLVTRTEMDLEELKRTDPQAYAHRLEVQHQARLQSGHL